MSLHYLLLIMEIGSLYDTRLFLIYLFILHRFNFIVIVLKRKLHKFNSNMCLKKQKLREKQFMVTKSSFY